MQLNRIKNPNWQPVAYLQAWPRIWTRDGREQIQQVARAGWVPWHTVLMVQLKLQLNCLLINQTFVGLKSRDKMLQGAIQRSCMPKLLRFLGNETIYIQWKNSFICYLRRIRCIFNNLLGNNCSYVLTSEKSSLTHNKIAINTQNTETCGIYQIQPEGKTRIAIRCQCVQLTFFTALALAPLLDHRQDLETNN